MLLKLLNWYPSTLCLVFQIYGVILDYIPFLRTEVTHIAFLSLFQTDVLFFFLKKKQLTILPSDK